MAVLTSIKSRDHCIVGSCRQQVKRHPFLTIVITGFNTDIEHDGVVYHVQTEDKGLDSPLILSLVYSGGAILASKRSPYEDLIASGFNEEALAQRVKRQHRLICAAINAGRIEDLKKMGAKDEPVQKTAPVKLETTDTVVDDAQIAEDQTLEITDNDSDEAQFTEEQTFEITDNVSDHAQFAEDQTLEITDNASDYVHFAETAPPPAAVEPEPPPPPPTEASPYTVYDSRRQSPLGEASEPDRSLVVTVLDDPEFRAGQTFQIRMLVQDLSGSTEKPLAGIALSLKILGTSFRPQLYSVKTERDGVAVVSAQIPAFTTGRAAVLIRAVGQGRTTEMRRVIHPAK